MLVKTDTRAFVSPWNSLCCTATPNMLDSDPGGNVSEPCALSSGRCAGGRGVLGMADGDIAAHLIRNLDSDSVGTRVPQPGRGRGRAAESPTSGEEKDTEKVPWRCSMRVIP